jgi:hypothetical protein
MGSKFKLKADENKFYFIDIRNVIFFSRERIWQMIFLKRKEFDFRLDSSKN